MAGDIERLEIWLRARDAGRFQSALNSSAASVDRLGGAVKGVNGSGLAGTLDKIGRSALYAGGALGVAGAAVAVAGVKMGIEFNNTMDRQAISFKTLLGSAEKATAFQKEISDLSLKSPVLDVKSTGQAATTLMAYGIEADKTLDYVEALGNATVVSGNSIAETMPLAARALGQIEGKGKLSMEEMNQLAEGVGLSQARVRKELGMTKEEFSDSFTPGNAITSDKALPAILRAMQSMGGDAAEEYSKTFSGRLDGLKDITAQVAGQAVRPLMDAALPFVEKLQMGMQEVSKLKGKGGLEGAIAAFDRGAEMGGNLVKTWHTVRDTFNTVKDVVVGAATIIYSVGSKLNSWGLLVPGIKLLVGALIAFRIGLFALNVLLGVARLALIAFRIAAFALNLVLAANPVVLIVLAIAALVAGLVIAYQKVGWFRNIVNGAWGILKTVAGWIKANWLTIVSILGGPLVLAARLIAGSFGKIKSAASSVLSWLKTAFENVVGWFASLPGRFLEAAKSIGSAIVNGIVNAITSAPGAIKDAIMGLLPGPLRSVVEGALGLGGKAVEGIKDLAGGAKDLVGGLIPGGAKGGVFSGRGSWLTGENGPEVNTQDGFGNVSVQPLPAVSAGAATAALRPGGGGQPQVAKVYVGRRQIAEAVFEDAEDEEARR